MEHDGDVLAADHLHMGDRTDWGKQSHAIGRKIPLQPVKEKAMRPLVKARTFANPTLPVAFSRIPISIRRGVHGVDAPYDIVCIPGGSSGFQCCTAFLPRC